MTGSVIPMKTMPSSVLLIKMMVGNDFGQRDEDDEKSDGAFLMLGSVSASLMKTMTGAVLWYFVKSYA